MNGIIEFIIEFVHDEHRLSLLLFVLFFGYATCGALPYIEDLSQRKNKKDNKEQ